MLSDSSGTHKIVWIAFFSQTGSEIVELSKRLNQKPDLIITNSRPESKRQIHPELYGKCYTLPNSPTVEDYLQVLLEGDVLITLHGWLRIIPQEIIQKYPKIFNGHPALISSYPELKGKDPQEKILAAGNYREVGCVIHQVVPQVDEGPIYMTIGEPNIYKTAEELYPALHKLSITNWERFFKLKQDLIFST
jgi:folate-dependent phosphoribosylglycinamide formyltransferase PurN